MIEWHLEKRNIKDLKPNQKNPRQLSKDQANQLEKSIDKFGLCEPIVINLDNTIIGGHQRINILKNLNQKEVECYLPNRHLEDKETDELNIRLNKNSGEFNFEILANEWELTDLLDWGFSYEELQLCEDSEKEYDESIIDGLELISKFIISLPIEDSNNFEKKLDDILQSYPKAKKEKKI